MRTEPVSFPAALSTRELSLTDEVVFRHGDGDISMLLALALLLAANAIRARESFTLGYPGDARGQIARCEGGRLTLHKEVAATVNGMITFLDRFGSAVAEQVSRELPAPQAAGEGTLGPPEEGLVTETVPEEFLPPAV